MEPTAIESSLAIVLVDATAWCALFLYPFGLAAERHDRPGSGRLLFSLGAIVFLLHVALAFCTHYGLSHELAFDRVARDTEALTGFATGVGLYLNYLFALLWLGDVAWWWLAPERYAGRSAICSLVVHGFFLFMILNGAVVFVRGWRKALGILVLLACSVAVARRRRAVRKSA